MTKIAVLDASFIIGLIERGTIHGEMAGGLSAGDVDERLTLLLGDWEKQKVRLVLPAPAFSEALIKRPGSAEVLLASIRKASQIVIGSFGSAAAAECADLMRKHFAKRQLPGVIARSKIKFDLQILAIAKVSRASLIYTSDGQLRDRAVSEGIRAVTFGDLAAPKVDQKALDLRMPERGTDRTQSAASSRTPPT